MYCTNTLYFWKDRNRVGRRAGQGGAAAVLGAFESIVKTVATTGFSSHLYAVVCLAENAIGPEAYRPDDM